MDCYSVNCCPFIFDSPISFRDDLIESPITLGSNFFSVKVLKPLSSKNVIWADPISKSIHFRSDLGCEALYNIYLDYLDYFNFLGIIQERLHEDQRSYQILAEQHHKLLDRIMVQFEGREYRMSSIEQQEYQEMNYWQTKLMLDSECFFMFARILMDRLVKLAVCLINRYDIAVPTNSFTDHKKWLLKSHNSPFEPNEEYAKLVRDQTNWYDLSLAGIRDKTIVHGNARMKIISYPDQKITKAVRISSFSKENDQIILIKQKYETQYPELKNIYNLWEVLRYFLSHDIRFSREDMNVLTSIIEKTGSEFPDMNIMVDRITKYLQQFAQVFHGYPLN
jgi:hypothetical protein